MAPPKKKPSELKPPSKTFRLSQPTLDKIAKAVDSKAAKDQTEALERAVEAWRI